MGNRRFWWMELSQWPMLFANKIEKRKDIRDLLNKIWALDEERFADVNIAIDNL